MGLGAGTLAAYGLPGDAVRFYEIDPAVKEMAETRFTYLRDSKAVISIALGDARLSMEREPAQEFDLLVLDAFIGDAVPVHLLTLEAFEIYLGHLRPDGVILVHVTNRHFELAPVLLKVAERFQLHAALISNSADLARTIYESGWVLLSRNVEFLNSPAIAAASLPYYRYKVSIRLWSDDYASLFQVLK